MTPLRRPGPAGQARHRAPDIGSLVLFERARRRMKLRTGLERGLPVRIITDASGAVTAVSLNGEPLGFEVAALPAVDIPAPLPAWRRRLRAWARGARQQYRFIALLAGAR